MDLNTYQNLALRSAKDMGSAQANISHFAMGVASEAGELLTPIKAHLFYGKPLDAENVKEELGDVLWFAAALANALGFNLEEIAQSNVEKLSKRYPEKYSDAAALARADKAPQADKSCRAVLGAAYHLPYTTRLDAPPAGVQPDDLVRVMPRGISSPLDARPASEWDWSCDPDRPHSGDIVTYTVVKYAEDSNSPDCA